MQPSTVASVNDAVSMLSFPSRAASCIVIALCLGATQAQTINRCVDADGKVSFSDTDCKGTRTSVKITPATMGDGGAAKASAAQAAGERKASADALLRKYRDAALRATKLRSALDNNSSDRNAETTAIAKEIDRCRFTAIESRRCQEVKAMRQQDIDDKWHSIWMRDHRDWNTALDEKSAASAAYLKATGTLPSE